MKRSTFFALALACMGLSSGGVLAQTQEEPHSVVLYAGEVLADVSEKSRGPSTLVITSGRIDRIIAGHPDAEELGLTNPVVHDYRDKLIMPGLIDLHVHLSLVGPRASGVDEHMGAARALAEQHADVRNESYNLINASVAARRTLAAGYTTVRNIGDSGWHIFALRDGINKGVMRGPRILNAGAIIRIGADDGSGACTDVPSCKRAVRKQIDKGADWIKVYATCSGSKPCGHELAPPLFLEEELNAIVAVAATRQVKVAAHAHGTAGINAALEAGVNTIEHGSSNNKESHRLFKRGGAFLVPTLSVVLDRVAKELPDAKEPMRTVMQAFVDKHPVRLLAAHKAGVRVAAGSDAGIVAHGDNARELSNYVQIGFSEIEALEAGTITAAAALGMSDDLGILEVGRFADILVLQEDPRNNINALFDVVAVMQNGLLHHPEDLLQGLPALEEAAEEEAY
ncbi:MAG: amidohydrolase family protein [Pseudomonadota bacterium]